MNQIYCFGHRQPDTDSIASAIGYADFKNRSEPGRYVPARCGDLNGESRFMLERFGIPGPVFMPSVEPTLPISRTSRSLRCRRTSRPWMSPSSWHTKGSGTSSSRMRPENQSG